MDDSALTDALHRLLFAADTWGRPPRQPGPDRLMAAPTEADLRGIFALRPAAAIEYLGAKGILHHLELA
ncbi:DUF935 domain-containing protein [Pseudomonas aeruginosa]|uniref:DUF935 domain-containing protein n=1 Tax=Pseudomonas aeruginosa TaxID=287 RepID=UPI000AEB83D9|nr:DUF935 domain-containing protein [Pseudomonas aeruginosa]